VDILLGADHHELMYSMKEVVGEQGQPSARLCPLGWTAVGKVNGTESNGSNQTDFHHTYIFFQDKPLTFIKQIGILTGLEITADQRSMIGRKLFLIGEEATLPFILIGKKYI
jgi:hypothetical protein